MSIHITNTADITPVKPMSYVLTDARIAPGMRADLAIRDAETPAEPALRTGFTLNYRRFFGGLS